MATVAAGETVMAGAPSFVERRTEASPGAVAVSGTRCRCDACRMSFHVVQAPVPVVCPFCQARLTAEPVAIRP